MSITWNSNSKWSIMPQFEAWSPFFVIYKRKERFAINSVSESMNFTVCFIYLQKDTELYGYPNSKGSIMSRFKEWFPFFVIYKRKEHFVINGVSESMNFTVRFIYLQKDTELYRFPTFSYQFSHCPMFSKIFLKKQTQCVIIPFMFLYSIYCYRISNPQI